MCLFGWAKDFLTRLEEIVYFKEVIVNQAKVQSFIGGGDESEQYNLCCMVIE